MRDNCGVARIRRRIDRTQCLVRSGAGSSARFQNDDVGIVRAVEDGTALIAQAPQKFVLGEGRVTLNKIALAAGGVDIPDAIEVFINHKLHRSAKNEYAVKLIAPKKTRPLPLINRNLSVINERHIGRGPRRTRHKYGVKRRADHRAERCRYSARHRAPEGRHRVAGRNDRGLFQPRHGHYSLCAPAPRSRSASGLRIPCH